MGTDIHSCSNKFWQHNALRPRHSVYSNYRVDTLAPHYDARGTLVPFNQQNGDAGGTVTIADLARSVSNKDRRVPNWQHVKQGQYTPPHTTCGGKTRAHVA